MQEFYIWHRYIAKHGPVSMQRRAEVLTAYQVSTFANAHRGKNQKAWKLADFLLWSKGKNEQATDDEGGFLSAINALRKSTPPKKEGEQRRRLWVQTDGNT